MTLLLAGLALFLGVHSLATVAPGARARLVGALGEGPWKGLFSLVSLAGFALIIVGFGEARAGATVLYAPGPLLRHLAALLMLPVFPLAFAAYLPGRIQSTLKHPLLAATKTWAFAHLLANGSVADLALFGAFLVWAVAERISVKRRGQRPIRTAPPGRFNDLIAVVLGLVVYALLLGGLHGRLFGVDPLL